MVEEVPNAQKERHRNYPAPPHAFALWLDDELALRLRERHDAPDLYQRVAADRAHLGRWFGWARDFDERSIEGQVVKGLDQFVAGAGWHADLCWRGEPVGALWLHYLDGQGGSTEVGYWLASAHEGKGLITRAVRALLRHFFVERGLERVAIALDPRNERSLAVVERLGLEPEAVLRSAVVDADGAPGDLAFYGLLKDDWLARGDGPTQDGAGSPPRFAMCLDRDAGLYLAVFEREDAGELADLVALNEDHLRPWMPWVDLERPSSQLAFIEGRALPGLAIADGFECAIVKDGKIIGAAGVHDVNARARRGSIGYWLDKDHQGRGYVTAAVRAIIERCFGVGVVAGEPFDRLDVFAEVDNLRSRAVPERLGFTFEGVLRRHRNNGARYADYAVYSLLRGEYVQAKAEAAASGDGEPLEHAVMLRKGGMSMSEREPHDDKEREPGDTRDRTRQGAGDDALDDALDDSFPASDPPSPSPRSSGTRGGRGADPSAEERREREAALDDALDDSFPASDPPSQTVPTHHDE